MTSRTPSEGSGWSSGRLLQLSGWLFADLLLVLFVVFMAAQPTYRATPPPPPPSPSPPAPTAIPTPCKTEVDKQETPLYAGAGPGGTIPTDDQLRQAFASAHGKQAGIVLTFVTDVRIGAAQTEAAAVNDRLRAVVPDIVTDQTIAKPLGNEVTSGAGRGSTEMDVYFLVNACPGRNAS